MPGDQTQVYVTPIKYRQNNSCRTHFLFRSGEPPLLVVSQERGFGSQPVCHQSDGPSLDLGTTWLQLATAQGQRQALAPWLSAALRTRATWPVSAQIGEPMKTVGAAVGWQFVWAGYDLSLTSSSVMDYTTSPKRPEGDTKA